MPRQTHGRQSHGRSLLGNASSKKRPATKSKSKSKAAAHALDAFSIAQKQTKPDRLTRRGRGLDLDPEQQKSSKRGRDEEDDQDDDDDNNDYDEDDDEEEEGPRKKRARKSADDGDEDSDDLENGSVDGNEWHMGVHGSDEDSEIDSDEAFGDSEDEKFEGSTLRGSSSKKKAEDGESDDESLGEDAIDLADALDQISDEDEASPGDTESDSEDDDESSSETDLDDDDDVDDDDQDPSKVGVLQNLIKNFAEKEEMDTEPAGSKQTISLQDLGLSSVKDPLIKKSVKLMKKEEKTDTSKKNSSKKLDVPLPKRQQDRLLRAAAYEKTTETLDRWNDTVKHNRRADHLVFPLANTLPDAGLDNSELLPLTKKAAGSELEQTIMSIMEESGLSGPGAKPKEQKSQDAGGEDKAISQAALKELWNERRKQRELESRETKRSKRIKKIKSKSYRRVHRKQRLVAEEAAHKAMVAAGEIDSDLERQTADRNRALSRVSSKHRESKWAKQGTKRAAWDENAREGLTDMARRQEELRKRIEGTITRDGDDSEESSSSGDEDGNSRLLQKLNEVDDKADEEPVSNLRAMKFMQRAEADRKKANDILIAEIRRDIASGDEEDEDDDAPEVEVGRRIYGVPGAQFPNKQAESSMITKDSFSKGEKAKSSRHPLQITASENTEMQSAPGAAGAWSRAGQSATAERRRGKKVTSAQVAELDLSSAVLVAGKSSAKPKATKKSASNSTTAAALDSDQEEDAMHLPMAIRDQELIARAFAGEEVVSAFETEKNEVMSEDDEKVVDNTLPGWGSWVGDGISKRAQKRNKGKVMTKIAGIKKKDRKDAKLERVIISEKRQKKNDKYLASQLPHPFESREQYERSLRLPMGPEWMTKESFQDATKPRVIMKQGIIAPMAKPII